MSYKKSCIELQKFLFVCAFLCMQVANKKNVKKCVFFVAQYFYVLYHCSVINKQL